MDLLPNNPDQHVKKAKINKLHIEKSQQFNIIHLLFTITHCIQRFQNPKLGEILSGWKIMIISHIP